MPNHIARYAKTTCSFLTMALASTLLIVCEVEIAEAAVSMGVGYSTASAGRPVPGLALSYSAETWAVSGLTTGVQTPLYYHSAWMLSGLRTWRAGEFGVGAVDVGLGAALYYARRGYRETESSPLDTSDDFNIGPAFRVSWHFLGPAYLAAEAMFGLRKPANLIVLSAQDSAHVTLGVTF